jgi:peptidoglycan/xylan/chitin deacetylase (PgdA/CDA1 family)
MLTIIAYHYIRDLERSRYPAIKGRRTADFEGQLDYIQQHYNVVRLRDVVASSRGESKLPEAPCVLTFDDGLIDHFDVVLPRLVDRGIPAAFFASARPIRENIVLDVHKLHFVLASTQNHETLLAETKDLIIEHRRQHDLPSYEALAAEHYKPSRYDPAATAFIKRMLQFGLPLAVRSRIVTQLFERYVAVDEATFSRELYMDASQLRCLLRNGMELGGHGDHHERIGLLSTEGQMKELCATREFLRAIDPATANDWIMCFPFGSFSSEALEIATRIGCSAALSVHPALVPLPLELGATRAPVLDRLDTNDLPVVASAAPCEWTTNARR